MRASTPPAMASAPQPAPAAARWCHVTTPAAPDSRPPDRAAEAPRAPFRQRRGSATPAPARPGRPAPPRVQIGAPKHITPSRRHPVAHPFPVRPPLNPRANKYISALLVLLSAGEPGAAAQRPDGEHPCSSCHDDGHVTDGARTRQVSRRHGLDVGRRRRHAGHGDRTFEAGGVERGHN